jgi:hypothetical protein
LDFFGNIGTLYAQKPSGPTAGASVIVMFQQQPTSYLQARQCAQHLPFARSVPAGGTE